MKLHHILFLTAAIGLLSSCVHQTHQADQSSPDVGAASGSLVIFDVAQNVLADEQIPVQGWTSLDIVMREGTYDASDGVFVQINRNVRFVPWLDLIADPLGQRFYSDAFIKAGELTLRVTKAPCGGRLPLIFRVRELQPKVWPAGSATDPMLNDISYVPLFTWAESGLYLPDRFVEQIDGRWEEEECQPIMAQPNAAFVQQALIHFSEVRSAVSDRHVVAHIAVKSEAREQEPIDPWGRPCKICRKTEPDNDHDRGEHRHDDDHNT